jgi:hypothetical protein
MPVTTNLSTDGAVVNWRLPDTAPAPPVAPPPLLSGMILTKVSQGSTYCPVCSPVTASSWKQDASCCTPWALPQATKLSLTTVTAVILLPFAMVCVHSPVSGNTEGADEGWAEGSAVGCLVGWAVGISLGCPEGGTVGWRLGWAVGVLLGCAEGSRVGEVEGRLVGDATGCVLGWLDGLLLG